MNICIVANFPDLLNGKADMRFAYLAEILQEKGHDVELIISDFEHEVKEERKRDNYSAYSFKVTVLHEPPYHRNLSLKRLYAHYTWGKNVGKYLRLKQSVPDIIYVAIPSLTVAREVADYCKVHETCKMVIDIQDLWPEAFQMVVSNKLLKKAFFPITHYVNYAYKEADLVIGVSDTYRDRGLLVNSKSKKGLTVYIGNDGAKFDRGKFLYYEKRPSDEFWIAYIGTMGFSYDLKCIIEAIAIINKRGTLDKKVKFIAMGRGPLLEEFKKYAKEKGVNSEFTGALPYEKMVGMMCSCDVVMNCINPGAAQSITNKVGDYALSGLPVINTQENPEYRKLVEDCQCGINCECGNAEQVADAIERLALDSVLSIRMGENAVRLGRERFDRRYTYPKIVDALEQLCIK